MSKTEIKLINYLLQSYNGFYSVTTTSGRGPRGGKESSGWRDLKALRKLENAGILKVVRIDRSTHPESGYTRWTTDFVYTWSN